MTEYDQLIKEVFSNAKGQDLLDRWQLIYGDMIPFAEGTTHAESAFRDGQRAFFLMLKGIVENE